MTTARKIKTSVVVAAGLCVLLHPLDVRAWDTGPDACKHDECSGGKTHGKMGDTSLLWGGNTHLWIVNRAIDLLAKSTDPTAKNVVARMNSKACRERWESGLWEVDHGYLAEDLGFGQTRETEQRLGSHFYNGAGRDAWGKPTPVTTYKLLGFEKIAFGDARLNARYRLPGMLRRPGDNLPESNLTYQGVDLRPRKGETKGLNDREFLEMLFTPYYAGSFTDDTEKGNERCYDLGLALHYLTDVTEPFHASSFDAFSIPTMLHAVFEEYVPTIQANFPVGDQRWEAEQAMVKAPKSADEVFDEVARASNAMAPALIKVLTESPNWCVYNPEASIDYTRSDNGGCFRDPSRKAVVEAEVGKVLRATYQWVASYLWAAFHEEYQTTELGKRCPIGSSWGNDNKCYSSCPPGYKRPSADVETSFCIEVCPDDLCVDNDGVPRGIGRIARLSVPARPVK